MRRSSDLARPVRTLLAAATVLALALGACGDDDGGDGAGDGASDAATSSSTEATDDGAAEGAATIEARDFTLTSIEVAPGTEVEVVNTDEAAHTVTSDDAAFDSGNVAGGGTGTFTAPDEAGEYAFHCEIHPSMTGTLTVDG